MDYAIQSRFSDPGVHAGLFDALPDDIPGIAAVVRNLVIHYRGGGIEFTGERLAEIDNRWVSAILDVDQKRNGTPLAAPREPVDKVVGCCRDFTLLFVSVLRHKGIPARSRVGFADYFAQGFNHDHVVAEYWNGERWVMIDAQLDPTEGRPFDVQDMPSGPFRSAAEVWLGVRAGDLDPDLFGVDPGMPIGGAWFVRNYVHYQLAHLNGDELLLWDNWGSMSDTLDGADLEGTDRIARLMVAADNGDEAAAKEAGELYRTDPALTFTGRAFVTSPASGGVFSWQDLSR
ncbi:transglutaminase domain-containing protein [Kribbella sp. NPDC059898]|uniref:transglutaminase domain-containing protein n=1 Tax=Kribbella sp. NPDC059898 TaxID=3346995 RepID=UPI00365595CB